MASRFRLVSILQTVANNNNSKENTFTIQSKSTASWYHETGNLKEVTLHDGKNLVEDIVDGIFDANIGVANISSSQCSLTDTFESSEEMDERLKKWQDTLRDRLRMQEKIFQKTGKTPKEMLLNLPASVEQRDKGTVQRLMDFAHRMNPVALKQKKPAVLPERINKQTGICIRELRETLPQAEQDGRVKVEISGLPTSTRAEILNPIRIFKGPISNQKTKWQNSKELEKHIVAKSDDIKRVLEYCPDINRLEVVGNNNADVFHNEDINLLQSEDIVTISSSTESSFVENQVKYLGESPQKSPSDDINVGVMINDSVYTLEHKRNPAIADLRFNFVCEPYQRVLKRVLRMENIGKKVVICSWIRSDLKSECGKSFLFNHKLILLFPGEVYKPKVLFQPNAVCRCKQRWELKIFPNVFCGSRGSLVLQLSGKCVPSAMYLNKVNLHLKLVVDKCNDQVIRELSTRHGKLAPIIETPTILCPYERNLDERELFNALNPGYHCERFEDLENLRTLNDSLKLPREPTWDLRVDTIKNKIMSLSVPGSRESNFKKLIQILQSMKSYGNVEFSTFEHNQERNRSRLIYVRGCIANGIEEWEELMLSIEETCLKSELVSFYAQSQNEEEMEVEGEEDSPSQAETRRQFKHKKLENYLLKKLRAKKYYRDSLYIQTYTLMCDIAENMVSIIESTEFI